MAGNDLQSVVISECGCGNECEFSEGYGFQFGDGCG